MTQDIDPVGSGFVAGDKPEATRLTRRCIKIRIRETYSQGLTES